MKIFIYSLSLMMLISGAVAQSIASINDLLDQGEQHYQRKEYAEALAIFTNAIRLEPGLAAAYLSRAYTKEKLHDPEGAITDFNIYLELNPSEPEALFSRGLLCFQTGRFAQAKDDFLKVLALPAGETNTIFYQQRAAAGGSHQLVTAQGSTKALLLNYIGCAESKSGHHQQAIIYLDSAIAMEPMVADYYVNRGLAKEGLQDPTAISDYKTALELQQDHPVALYNLGVWQRKELGKTEVDYLEYAIESDSSMLAPYLERAYQRMEGGYYKGALEDYTSALEINPKDPEIWLNSGLARERLQDLKGAYSDYTNAIELNEKFEKAWLNRGNVLSKMGRHQEAVEDYTVAILHYPEYPAAFYNRALAHYKLKQLNQACNDLKRAELLGQQMEGKIKKEICK